jgi:DNA primase
VIPKEEIEEIISQIDLREYIEFRGFDTSNGKINCPLPGHDDSTPSFSIKEDEQYYNCFGCDRGGNVLNFIMDLDEVNFVEAVKAAADYAGYKINVDKRFGKEEEALFKEFEKVKDIYEDAAKYCHKIMPMDIKEHLINHYGFTEKFIEEKKIGFDDGHLKDYLLKKYSEEEILKTGLFVKTKYGIKDRFDTRIMFWYYKRHRPVYVIGRETEYTKNLDDYEKYHKGKKYLKLPVYSEKKRPYISQMVRNDLLYNEDICYGKNRPDYIVITEGITDAMIAEMKGIPVISPVTRKFRNSDIQRLNKLLQFIDHIFLANDNEENEQGLKGALDTGAELSKTSKDVKITILPRPDGTKKVDLNEFLQGMTKDEFEDFLDKNSHVYQEFLLDKALEYKDKGDDKEYIKMRKRLFYEAKFMKPIPQEQLFKKISKALDIQKRVVVKQFKEVIKEESNKPEVKDESSILERKKEKAMSDAEQLFSALRKKGAKFFRDNEEIMMILDGDFYPITDGKNSFTVFLMNEYNLNYLDFKTKKIIFELSCKAKLHAQKKREQTWLFYDKKRNIVYLGTGSNSPHLIKISEEKIDKVFNGEDSGVFITPADGVMDAWDFDRNIDQGKAAKDLFELFVNYLPTNKKEAMIVLFSVLALPLKRITDTIPLIKVHGQSSAGKTQVAKSIVNLIYGNEKAVGDMTDASKFDQASLRPIMIFDNKEVVNNPQTINFLLYSATGGVREKMDRSTERGTIKQIVDTLSVVTAIHPFEKQELLNRSFDIYASKDYHRYDRDINNINHELSNRRDEFLSLWMFLIRECLKNKEEIFAKKDKIRETFKKHFKERLNGYWAVMWQMAEHFLMRIGWSREEVAEVVDDWIDSQSKKGIQNEKETSEVFNYMNTLASYIKREKHNDLDIAFEMLEKDRKEKLIIIETTGRDLLNAFKAISKRMGDRTTSFTSTQKLMARLRSEIDILTSNSWKISLSIRKVSGDNVHRLVYEYDVEENTSLTDWDKED